MSVETGQPEDTFDGSWSIAALASSQIGLFIHRHHLGILLAVGSDWPVWFGLDPKVSLTMSLDTEQIHRLTSKGFDKLYSSDPDKFTEMAHTALDYAKTCVPAGEKVRVGDVVLIITNAVRILPSFEAYFQKKKLKEKYWQELFAEYILEQVFPQPELTKKTVKP